MRRYFTDRIFFIEQHDRSDMYYIYNNINIMGQ